MIVMSSLGSNQLVFITPFTQKCYLREISSDKIGPFWDFLHQEHSLPGPEKFGPFFSDSLDDSVYI